MYDLDVFLQFRHLFRVVKRYLVHVSVSHHPVLSFRILLNSNRSVFAGFTYPYHCDGPCDSWKEVIKVIRESLPAVLILLPIDLSSKLEVIILLFSILSINSIRFE